MVKTRMLWFGFGFIVCALVCVVLVCLRNWPRDFRSLTTKEFAGLITQTEDLSWMRRAQVKTVGSYLIVTPSTPKDADAFIVPLSKPHFPMFILGRSTSNGI